jgi:ADA HAT complex component 1
MSHQPRTYTNFSPPDITLDTFKALLDCYPATVKAVTHRKATTRIIVGGRRSKKPSQAPPPSETKEPELDEKQKSQIDSEVQAYLGLDEFRYESLPELVKGRATKNAYLEKEELERVVEWKL